MEERNATWSGVRSDNMKLIIAIIQPYKLDEVHDALAAIGLTRSITGCPITCEILGLQSSCSVVWPTTANCQGELP